MKAQEALLLVNQRVRNLKAYYLAPAEVDVKLNQNENPYDWPAEIKQEVARFCAERPWNRYPDFIPQRLKEALAAHVGMSADNIIVGNGSNEMLLVLMLSLAGMGRKIILCEPTFTVYRLLSDAMGAETIPVRLRDDLAYDVDALCRAGREHAGAVMLAASPNNPTGSALTGDDVRRLLAAHRGMLVLDQAYVEFGGFNAVSLVNEYANLIVTRTFSKAMAGAGLRLGYMIGDARVVAEFNKVKLPYNINFFSDHVAQVLLGRRDIVDGRVAQIVGQREALHRFLKDLPLDACYPSAANFILVRTRLKDALFAFLKQRSVLVRDVSSYPMLENCLRISVGSPAENDALRAALADFFSQSR
jgi:histidinol-phosphate aminotransferase